MELLLLSSLLFLSLLPCFSSPLLLPLSHSLSPTLFNSTPHLLKSTSSRSATRFRHHHRRRRVSLPLSPGADYTLSFSLGPQTISLYLDTGSDVVWVPCHPFDCILCEGKYSPSSIPHPSPLNLSSATPLPCKSPLCSAVHSSLPSSHLCAIANCPLETIEISDCRKFSCPSFYYAYGDGSFVAKLYHDTLSSSPSFNLPNFTFGCAHSALGEPIGVAGFGRGRLSFPAQLARTSPDIGNYFSYCLIAHAFDAARVLKPSPLILGRREKKKTPDGEREEEEDDEVLYSYTPMLYNPKHPYFYCVGLEAVSIGNIKIPAPESLRRVDRRGDGGMVVDSGTTFTMLPRKFYLAMVGEFGRSVGAAQHRRARGVEERTGLSPCYYGESFDDIPRLTWHFGGNSTVAMPRENYFYEFLDGDAKKKVGCVMVMDGGDEAERGGGPAGLLGNYQQQGFEVVYDLEAKRLGFARRKCASLWDTLN
ncbi:putative aspartyl protease [Salvia divinorum]|uniref:Aspartyl protease n=1 Tax=Salvia divinorum TaxID=28513 RepID=A0ABD1HXE7_SALDI